MEIPLSPGAFDQLVDQAWREAKRRAGVVKAIGNAIPPGFVVGLDGQLESFHRGQQLAWDCPRRTVAVISGVQSGKTVLGPPWMWREIQEHGPGDYLAVTANYGLFKLKMLPALRMFFEGKLGIGRYWSADRLLEIADPVTGAFLSRRASDLMWARIILRSADALGGLESATAKAEWLDEAGQPEFTYDAWKAVKGRLGTSRGRLFITSRLFDVGWLDDRVLDKAKRGGHVFVETVGDAVIEVTDNPKEDIGLVQYDSTVNPAFSTEEFDAARAELRDDEWHAMYRGQRVTSSTTVFDCFDRQRNTCPRFPIPEDWQRYLGADFGPVHTAGQFFAEEPGTHKLYWYRDYLEGGRTTKEHADAMLEGEPGRPIAFGGVGSEAQWRRDLAAAGLPIREPDVSDFDVGIQRVYACIKNGQVVIFDDLTAVISDIQKYRRKRDRQGNVTKQIEQKESFHRCLVGGTPVTTKTGLVPIETVRINDEVLTRKGWRKVCASGCTGRQHVLDLKLSDGRRLIGTRNHPVYIEGRGFVTLDALRYGDRIRGQDYLLGESQCASLSGAKPLSIKALSIIGILRRSIIPPEGTSDLVVARFIDAFGKTISDLYRRGIASTIEMATWAITTSQTLNVFLSRIITPNTTLETAHLQSERTWTESGRWQRSGTAVELERIGTASMGGKFGNISRRLNDNAKTAVPTSRHDINIRISDFVRSIASRLGVVGQDLTMLTGSVLNAEKCSVSTGTPEQDHVPVYVVRVKDGGIRNVFNLTVERQHEFFANGILVANCDAARYVLSSIRPDRPKAKVVRLG